MPRAIDLTPQNLQVTSNPNNTLGVGPGQLQNIIADITNIPAVTIEAIEQFINQFLTYFDQATGIDLLPLIQDVEAFINALLGIFGLGTFTGGNGSTSGTSLGDILAAPIDLLDAFLSVFGLGALTGNTSNATGLGSSLGGILNGPIDLLNAMLSIFGLGNLTGSNGGSLGNSLGNLLELPITILTDLLSFLGLGSTLSSGSGSALTAWFSDLLALLGDPAGLGSGNVNIAVWAADFIQNILNPTGLLMSAFSPLNALNLVGEIPLEILGLVPAASVNGQQPNRLLNPSFDTAQSVQGHGEWSWDGTVYPTSSTASTPGSATITANGTQQTLLANRVRVTQGQEMTLSAMTLFNGLTGSGSPVQLILQTFSDTAGKVLIGTQTIASVGASGGSAPSAWTGAPSGAQQATLSGTYTVPAGVNTVGLGVQVTGAATAGQVWFGNGVQQFTNLMSNNLMYGLTGAGSTIGGDLQGTVDNIVNALTGGSTVGNPIDALLSVLTLIPFNNVTGMLGGTIGDTIQLFIDTLSQALGNVTGSGFSFAQLANFGASLFSVASNSRDIAQNNSNLLAMRTLQKPGYHAVDPTLDGVFHLTAITGSSPSTISVTQASTAIGFVRIPDAAEKHSIAWLGSGTSGLSAAYLNLYSVDTGTGALTNVWHSGNIISSIGSAMSWIYVPLGQTVSAPQGSVFAAELQVVGSGTHNMVGLPNHWLPANANVYPQQLGATRPATAPPVYGATGSGGHLFTTTGGSGPVSVNGSHTIAAGDNAVVILGNVILNTTSATFTATYGGQSMTLQGTYQYYNSSGTGAWVVAFALMNPPSGAQTTTLTVSFSGSVTTQVVDFRALSYSNASGFGPVATNGSSSSSAMSLSVPGTDATQMVAQMFGTGSYGSYTISGYNHTQRAYVAATSTQVAYLVGDAAGASGLSFSATINNSEAWGGIAVPVLGAMIPAPSTIASPAYSSNVPFIALSSLTQGTTGSHVPDTTIYTDAGTRVYNIPSWAQVDGTYIDLVCLGGGGAGSGEYGTPYEAAAGAPGSWAVTTLQYGSAQIPDGTTTLTAVVGAGGTGATAYFESGGNGQPSQVTLGGTVLLSAAGGAAGVDSSGTGKGPGNETYQGRTYYGGTAVGANANGSAPGGGGSGAIPFSTTSGSGAAGMVAITVRES